jgi:hypothetical protein
MLKSGPRKQRKIGGVARVVSNHSISRQSCPIHSHPFPSHIRTSHTSLLSCVRKCHSAKHRSYCLLRFDRQRGKHCLGVESSHLQQDLARLHDSLSGLALQCLCLQSLGNENEHLSSLADDKRISSVLVSSVI